MAKKPAPQKLTLADLERLEAWSKPIAKTSKAAEAMLSVIQEVKELRQTQQAVHPGDELPSRSDIYLVCIKNDNYRHHGWRLREFFAGTWMFEEQDGECAEEIKILGWTELPPILEEG